MRLHPILLLPALMAVAAAPPLAAADTPIAATASETPISAYGGWTAWSTYDTTSKRYSLTLERDGRVTRSEVATSDEPFDVSVGPDARGAPVALYTRAPAGSRRTRDAYRLDLRSGTERRLSLSSPSFDEHAPTQWRSAVAFARTVKRRSGSKTISCDVPYIRIAGRSKRLDRGHCASVTGQLLRATTLLQATIAIASRNGSTGAPTTSELRSVTRTRGSRRLISQGSGEESNLFSGLAADGSYVYSTRIGVRPSSAFVRIDRRSGAVREVRAQTGLAGGLALDAGRVTYLELQGTFKGGDCGAVNPCRIVRASADPFGSEERPLAPKLALVPPFDTQDPAAQPRATQPLTLSGKLTRSIVQGGVVVRTEVVPGVPIELRGGQRYEATGLTTTTDAEGAFALTVAAPLKPFSSFLVRTGGPDVPAVAEPLGVDARPDVTLSTSAAAVPSGGQVTFSGTVDPAQPGRTVKIQRLVRRTCKTGANGRRFCQEGFETVADAPLAADGRSFSTTASLSQSGEYTAVLPFVRFDQPGADTAYAGRSEVKTITVG